MTSHRTGIQKLIKVGINGFMLTPFLICLLIFAFFVVIKSADEAICMHQIAKRIPIDPTYEGLRKYIQSSLAPGITREEAMKVLKKIGPVEVDPGTNDMLNLVVDQVWLNICSHPFNHILLFVLYTPEGKLISIKFGKEW